MGNQRFTMQSAMDLDKKDPLKRFRSKFKITDPSLIYVDGNSLGRLPVDSEDLMHDEVSEKWGTRLIRGWNEGWWEMPMKLGEKLAPLIGARPDEVLVCDSTSMNLFKLVWAALSYKSERNELISDTLNFPSDLYIMQGIVDQHPGNQRLTILESHDGITLSEADLKKTISGNTALVSLSYVCFKSAFMHDMEQVTRLAHSKGALMLWDLSHAAGAVPVDLNGCQVDLAVGCTYKYLNGGPGSPAYLYVRRDLQDRLKSPVWGWLGEKNPFDFAIKYKPSTGIRKFLAGSPPVLSAKPIEVGIDLLVEAGMDRIRKKSVQLTEFLIALAKELLLPLDFAIGSPPEASRRGSHLSLKHPEAYRICKALSDPREGLHTIIPDFRGPDTIRIGVAPLYNSFEEVYIVVEELKRIVEQKVHENYDAEQQIFESR